MPSRARCGVLTSNPLRFCSRVFKVAARSAFYRAVVRKLAHSSRLECAKRKVETFGPAPIVAARIRSCRPYIQSRGVLTTRKLTPKILARVNVLYGK